MVSVKRRASHRVDVFVFLTAPRLQLTDTGKVTGERNVQAVVMREREEEEEEKGGGGVWDSYLIKCCFRGNLEIFFRDSSALHPAADFKSPTLGHTDCEAFWGCQGTGRVTG